MDVWTDKWPSMIVVVDDLVPTKRQVIYNDYADSIKSLRLIDAEMR